ncbi:hypothetical protein HHK36_002765 [Tetracentron sinense]|uniref:Uncharacterized protein n=1 Tax=Tetracentron sinense TaxID=13715 RepID=A0A834ZW92_TETSI|nr:hypothetical protein HHK36_002765 [Tetracentron sinense]
MDTAKPLRFSARVLWIFFFALLDSYSNVSADGLSLVVARPTTLNISSGLPVEISPGSKPGALMVCERVQIHGLSRLKDLKKFAHSMKVKVKVVETSPRVRLQKVEVCFHRNTSLAIGMCPQGQWEKLAKGSWVRSTSPYDHKLLDIRMPGPSFEIVEVSIKEEFLLYRVLFLIMGIIMMMLAPSLSKSIVFYYSSAMAVGVILVILMVLFQGMKLLPTGRKSSLAIFMYSSVIGVGSFLLRYLPGLLRSVLVEIGISEDMYNPVNLDTTVFLFRYNTASLNALYEGYRSSHTLNLFFAFLNPKLVHFGTKWRCIQLSSQIKVNYLTQLAIFLLVCVVLAGAWLGFWAVRTLVVAEDGSVDLSVAHFVSWSIQILAAVMILQCSLDPLLAAEALISGILISSIMSKITKTRFMRHLYKRLFRTVKSNRRRSRIQDLPFEDSHEDYYVHKIQSSEDLELLRPQARRFTLASCNSPIPGSTKTPPCPPSASESYYSTFHTTSERNKFSKDEWERFTRDSTKRALEGLVSSPDFNKWAVANAERITLTPTKDHSGTFERRRRWLNWL